jgi:hypothetical protein
VDLLDYTLAQLSGYGQAHRRMEAQRRALDMDAARVAANADADDYVQWREQLLDVDGQAEDRRYAADRAGMEQAFSLPAGWDESG